MSAGGVRQGKVFVEVSADTKGFFASLRRINQQIAQVGGSIAGFGTQLAGVGGSIVGPIAAAGVAFAATNAQVVAATESMKSVGEEVGKAVAPAYVGLMKVLGESAQRTAAWISANQKLVRQAAVAGAAILGVGTALVFAGKAITGATSIISTLFGPLYAIGKGLAILSVNLARVAASAALMAGRLIVSASATAMQVAAMAAANPVIAAFGLALAGIGVAALASSVDLSKMSASVGGNFAGAFSHAKKVIGEMADTTRTAMDGVFNAISAGDLAGAVEIAWAGVHAVWLQGQKAVMDAVDPWVSMIQNAFDYLRTNVVNNWDALQTDSAAAVRTMNAIILGIFDNLANGVMATFDKVVGEVQKAWIRVTDFFNGAKDTQSKLDAIDKENQARADERGKMRPGVQKRLADATAVNQLNEGFMIARQERNRQQSDDRMAGREDANRARAQQRADDVAAARSKLNDLVAKTSEPGPISVGETTKTSTAIAGTFSAFGIDQMGSQSVQKQQLDALLKIQAGIEDANRVGGIVA